MNEATTLRPDTTANHPPHQATEPSAQASSQAKEPSAQASSQATEPTSQASSQATEPTSQASSQATEPSAQAPVSVSVGGGSAADATDEAALQIDERKLTRLALWERKLLDFSLRNNLLNTRLGKRAMQFAAFDITHLEDNLQDGANYTISPWPEKLKKTEPASGIYDTQAQTPKLRQDYEAALDAHQLLTYLPPAELKPIVTNLYRSARTALEENGANALFIAVGILKWYVTDSSNQPRYAPIMLIPVNLVRNGAGYVVRLRDEEPMLNITLGEFLRQQYKLQLPTLDPLPHDDHGIDVGAVLAVMRRAVAQNARWEVLEESMLGLFSFNKFVMWNDIHSCADILQQNPIVKGLAEQRLTLEQTTDEVDVRQFDLTAQPADVATPISVDSSQLEAVIDSGQGKSFILYGPPGTGKSQTITNMIANALYQGRRVLFVAEKMAALSVVQKRLAKIGLDPFCLELHSNKVTKSHFLEQLNQALSVTHGHINEDFKQRSQQLFELRQQLNGYMQAVHAPGVSGLSVYECIERYTQAKACQQTGDTQAAFDADIRYLADTKTAANLEALKETLAKADTIFKEIGHPHNHPLNGLAPASDRRDALAALETLLQRLATSGETPAQLNTAWAVIQQKWFLPRWLGTHKFLKRLRRIDPATTKATIADVLDKLGQFDANGGIFEPERWLAHRDQWRGWHQWAALRESLIADGWEPAVALLEAGDNPDDVAEAAARLLCKEWALAMIDDNDDLRQFSGLAFEDVIARYRQLTDYFQELTKKELYCRLAANIPSFTTQAATSSEAGILKRNIANGGRGTSIRHIIDQIPNLLPRLCPCMLMSPISVAQFIDPKSPKFDLVIFDEASQMPTSEAVGAIGRGKALIVVGDNKQMPPTAFFATQQVDDDDAQFDDLDSILDDCKALSMPEHYLSVHYRSKHESLIAFSNQEYYDSRLFTFPSADDRISKVSVQYVQGTYDKGGRRSNRAEAEAVVKEVTSRLRDPEMAKRSIGVVAFSMAQQNLIEDILMEALANEPELEARAFQSDEPIFLKNLENVQGDERDVILFSIGYGPDSQGNVSLNFGPLNNRGGERRLNVAVSRARYEMKVFSTLRPEQIDLNRSKAVGVAHLRKFLLYAQTGQLIDVDADGQATAPTTPGSILGEASGPDAVAADIAAELTARGYQTQTAVGRSQFKVDVAVLDPADPERYLLGLLIDTPSRAATKIARDRELTQPSVLQSLGWKVCRIWSIDWLQHRQRVVEAIVGAIEGEPTATAIHDAAPLKLTQPIIVAEKTKTTRPAAVVPQTGGKRDIDEIPTAVIDKAVLQVVQDQVALPLDGIKLAANRLMGYSRRSLRIDNAITRSVARLIQAGKVARDGDTIKAI